MGNVIDFAKRHILIVGGVAVVAFIIFYRAFSGSGSSSSTGSPSDIYGIQAAAQAQSDQLQAGLSAAQLNASTNLQALQIKGQNDLSIAQLQQQLGLAQISATQETTDLANTLTANVQQANIAGQVQVAGINSQTQIQTTQAYTNALVQESIAAQQTAQAAIGSHKCGLLGSIFGC